MNGLTELQVANLFITLFGDCIIVGLVIGFVYRGFHWLFK